ncbi:MAG: DNA translocase FtsK, partial [Candidatus Limnocylindria bacterium]
MLDAAVGRVGAWLVLLAGVCIGVLCVTQVSYGALSRALGARLTAWKRRGRAKAGDDRAVSPAPSVAALALPELSAAGEESPPLVVVEPRSRGAGGPPRQETLNFTQGGAAAFQLPPLGLLRVPDATEHPVSREELQDNAETLRRKLLDFEVEGRNVQVSPGPVITSYEFEPAAGVKISRVVNLSDDLALALKAAAVRIVGPIPGRGTVAIEVPNAEPALVHLQEMFASAAFTQSKRRLPLALGKDVTGGPVVSDLTAMPHLLIAGATGTGKSVGLNAMICSILYTLTPADVRFLMIDPKRLELTVYEGIPHLLARVVTDAKEAAARLRWIVGKMDERYGLLQARQVRNIEGYN